MTEKTMATGGAVLFWSIGEASDVRELRQAFLDAMGGTRLRPSGGLYWLKDGADLDRFAELSRKVEAAACLGSKSSVYIIRHAMDLDALRAVRDAINAEIARDAAEIQDQVTSG